MLKLALWIALVVAGCGPDPRIGAAHSALAYYCDAGTDCPAPGKCFTSTCGSITRQCRSDTVGPCTCTTNADCNDNNECTDDSCSAGTCNNAFRQGQLCCNQLADCDPNPCQNSAVTCTDHFCVHPKKTGAGCCTVPSECTAGNTCVENNCCPIGSRYCEASINCISATQCCGNVECPTPPNAVAGNCMTNACKASCSASRLDCNGVFSDGCEVDKTNDVDHCGTCPTVCPTRANAQRVCSAGLCNFVCNSGYANCNALATDGCEVDARIDPEHCGGCTAAAVCPPSPLNGARTCVAGKCDVVCESGFRKCGGSCVFGNCCGDEDCTSPPDTQRCYRGSCGSNICGYAVVTFGPCTSGDKCKTGEICGNDGRCSGGTAKTCAISSEPCLVNACDPASGDCVSTPTAGGMSCTSGNPCVTNESCNASGSCVGAIVQDGTACAAAGCAEEASCVAGVCVCGADGGATAIDMAVSLVGDMAQPKGNPKSGGCDYSGSAPLGGTALLLLALLFMLRRSMR